MSEGTRGVVYFNNNNDNNNCILIYRGSNLHVSDRVILGSEVLLMSYFYFSLSPLSSTCYSHINTSLTQICHHHKILGFRLFSLVTSYIADPSGRAV